MSIFTHWFHSKESASTAKDDGLTQGEREAIVDLLNFCSFVDHDISDAEERIIDGLEEKLNWDQSKDFDYYVNKSVGFVREFIESKDDEYFFEEVSKRLISRDSRKLGVSLSERLLRADGELKPEEVAALDKIKKCLQ
jgi:hypothetical protein